MSTKALRRFIQRVDTCAEDLELCDLLVRGFGSLADTPNSITQVLGSTQIKHPALDRRTNSRASRMICGNHLKHTLYVAFVKDLHEDFSEFLTSTMTRAAQKGVEPARFIGDAKLDLHAKEILEAGSWDQAVRVISDAIFRKLENERNTRVLIEKVNSRIGLRVDLAILVAAMPYLDARHMLVHQDAKADAAYLRDHPHIRLRDGRIIVDFAFVSAARIAVTALASHIDEKVIASQLVRSQDMSGRR